MNETYNAFLRVLDPKDNATGGGAASAVSGAMGAGLVGMVSRLSVGRKNMPEPASFYEDVDQQAQGLAAALMAGSNEDSAAFDKVMAAFRSPKSTDEEKAARRQAIQDATIGATEVPLQNAENCARVLALAAQLEGRSNKNAASDLDCAIYLANAGLKGALSNAEINISGIKDESIAAALSQRVVDLKTKII